MRRFIRYLYEYEQEKKMRNVGFVKVEQDVDQCVIHVHGKDSGWKIMRRDLGRICSGIQKINVLESRRE